MIIGRRFVLELCLGDNACAAVQEFDVNIPEVAIEAILAHLDAKNQLNRHLSGLSPTLENKALRRIIQETLAELQSLQKENRELLLLRDRARAFIPVRTGKRPVIH